MKYTTQRILLALFILFGTMMSNYTGPRSKRLNYSDERPFFEQLRKEKNKKNSKTNSQKQKKSSCGCKTKK